MEDMEKEMDPNFKRVETYDENGLVEIIYVAVEEQTVEELIDQKEQQLLDIYQQILALINS